MRYLFLVESALVKGLSVARFGKDLGTAERIGGPREIGGRQQ
jgi:hypothetical protein